MGLGLKICDGFCKLVTLGIELVGINKNAGLFHVNKGKHGGNFDGLVDKLELGIGLDLRPQGFVQMQREVGVFAGVLAGLSNINLAKVNARGTLTRDIVVA